MSIERAGKWSRILNQCRCGGHRGPVAPGSKSARGEYSGCEVGRVVRASILACGVSSLAGVCWYLWATIEYGDRTGCPWNSQHPGHPVIAAAVLIVVAGALGGWAHRILDGPRHLVAGCMTAMLSAIVIAVVALAYGAGLGCTG